VVRRENAALTHEAETSIQPEESPVHIAGFCFSPFEARGESFL